MKNKDLSVLLFLVHFFEGIGLALRFPWVIFGETNLSKNNIKKYWQEFDNSLNEFQLYVHTLFCLTKCTFCNCVSYVESNPKAREKYLNYLCKEIKRYGGFFQKQKLNTIYFGGGTFTLWNVKEMKYIFRAIKDNFSFSEKTYFLVEINPNTTTFEKLEVLKENGVTDLMLGLQTTSVRLNKKFNRPYNRKKIFDLIDKIGKLGFRKLCFDMMYNLPGQKMEEVKADMSFLLEIGRYIDKNYNIELNLELNKWNISFSVPYSKSIIYRYNSFTEFVKQSIYKRKSIEKIVKFYIKKYFKDLYVVGREEIEARKEKNTGILGIGYGAISYIPCNIMYYNNMKNKTLYNWKSHVNNYMGLKISSYDDDLYYFMNNIRRGISKNKFYKVLFKHKNKKGFFSYIKKYKNDFKFSKNKVYLEASNDRKIDMIGLGLYSQNKKSNELERLLKKWEKIGYSKLELYNNIEIYLDIYYTDKKIY